MLVEHTFVTTMEAAEAMQAASAFLQEFGFVAEAERAFQVDAVWNAIEMKRGSSKPRRNLPIRDWPQQVRLEWDRGRVEIAASMAPPTRRGLDTGSGDIGRRDTATVQEVLLAFAQCLEVLLTDRDPQHARQILGRAEQQMTEKAARDRRRRRLVTLIAVAFFVLLISVLVVLIVRTSSHRY